jgi:hypothetical protein
MGIYPLECWDLRGTTLPVGLVGKRGVRNPQGKNGAMRLFSTGLFVGMLRKI